MTRRFTVHLLLGIGALTVALGSLPACSKQKLIPNTAVADTTENREILGVLEKYRQAMERLDAAGVLTLTHPSYRDNSGTPEGMDDIDYETLKNVLRTHFKRSSKITYRIEYQQVRRKGQMAEVDAYVDATFVYDAPDGTPRWRRLTDHNRFHLIEHDGGWQIVSGL